jgi:uncharacterized protein
MFWRQERGPRKVGKIQSRVKFVMSIPYYRMRDRYYRIIGSKCEKCGEQYFPPVNICRKCKNTHLENFEMPKDGSVLSYTLQKESVSGFEEQEPMVFGLIQLSNGVRIVAQIVDLPYESLKIGTKVTAVFRRVKADGPSGQIFYGYKFGPVRSGTLRAATD